MIKIAIVIVNWQQAQLTLDTIGSLSKIRHPHFSYHIFLVDNGSQDTSPDIFRKKYSHDSKITLIFTPSNLGFAAGNNIGIKAALVNNYQYILLINTDVIVDPDFVEEMLKLFEQYPQLGIVGPKIYFAPGYEFHKDRYTPQQIGKVIWSAGGQVEPDARRRGGYEEVLSQAD